jgi:hypothetical protein
MMKFKLNQVINKYLKIKNKYLIFKKLGIADIIKFMLIKTIKFYSIIIYLMVQIKNNKIAQKLLV